MKLYTAKLNINENIFTMDEDNNETLYKNRVAKQILSFSTLEYSKRFVTETTSTNKWTFSDINQLNTDTISGNLVLNFRQEMKELHGSSLTTVENDAAAQSARFFYIISREILIFQSNSEIDNETFLIYFKKLLEINGGLEKIGEVELSLYTDSREVENIFKNSIVTKVNFHFIQPNSRKAFHNIFAVFDDNGSTTGNISMNNNNGLETKDTNQAITPDFKEMLDLSNSGYGDIDVSYKPDAAKKQTKRISTKETPITGNISENELNDPNRLNDFFERMLAKIGIHG